MRKTVLKFISFQQMLGSAIEGWELVFRIHETRRMFERYISEDELNLATDEFIKTYNAFRIATKKLMAVMDHIRA